MKSRYMEPVAVRRENRTLAGRFKGGKLAPVMAVPFRESESGTVTQSVIFELDPVAGRMITEVTAENVSVYVPAPAIDALKNPTDDYPGNAEVFRQKLLSGNPVFDLEAEGELTKRMGVVPRSVGGVKMVNEAARIAHNCAVNFLRRRKYVLATQLLANSTAMTPAIIGKTVLDRLNGVLDPEDRIDGAVDLSADIPISGIVVNNTAARGAPVANTLDSSGNAPQGTDWVDPHSSGRMYVEMDSAQTPDRPKIFADFQNGSIRLKDFYTAEKMDELTRMMRDLVDKNPQYGEELVSRFAHGLSVEIGNQPFVVYQKEHDFSMGIKSATDGANLDKEQSNLLTSHEFTVPIPATEFGGILITFAVVKPDEALASQPHPILSQEWGAINYVADELAIDPVPVTIRELYADCAQADEETIALYVGNNHLKKTYVNYGFNRHLDINDVAEKTALWQLEVPMSVTPETVIYPETLSHYPFVDQTAEVCTYTVSSNARINTPTIFGPTPVEELAQIETDDIFEDAN